MPRARPDTPVRRRSFRRRPQLLARASDIVLTAFMRWSNVATNGFWAGGVAMNCFICVMVARRMNRGGIILSPRRRRICDRFAHPRADPVEPQDVVDRVLVRANGW